MGTRLEIQEPYENVRLHQHTRGVSDYDVYIDGEYAGYIAKKAGLWLTFGTDGCTIAATGRRIDGIPLLIAEWEQR